MGRLEDAMTVQKTNPVEAETQYKAILSVRPETNDAALKEYEQALMALGELYRDGGCVLLPGGGWQRSCCDRWDGSS